jgi:dipeptidyl aminopeptidase/acylaminoacyl peptidase
MKHCGYAAASSARAVCHVNWMVSEGMANPSFDIGPAVPGRVIVLFLVWILLSPSVARSTVHAKSPEHESSNEKRPVNVRDSIRMTTIGNPYYWEGVPSRGLVAQFSPDRKKFLVILRRGNLERNTNEYSMLLWHTADIFRSSEPTTLLTLSSSSNRPAIHDVKWLRDDDTVTFLGERPGEQQRLYRFSLGTRVLQKFRGSPARVLAYGTTSKGDRFACLVEKPVGRLFDAKARREGVPVANQHLAKLLLGEKGPDWGPDRLLFFQSEDGTAHTISGNRITEFWLSPNGRYIASLSRVADMPIKWREYSDPELQKAMAISWAPGQYTWVTRYELIDTSTGAVRVLLDAPEKSGDTELAWAPDSNSVVITNTYLPLDTAHGRERDERLSVSFTVEVNLRTGDLTPISRQALRLSAWDSMTNLLVFELGRDNDTGASGQRVFCLKVKGQWESRLSSDDRPQVVLEEAPNEPPKIVALDQATNRRSLLLDLNPQFRGLAFGKVEEIEWKCPDGHQVKGGLYYPVHYEPGRRYPLVIQTHWWNPHRFWIDGPWTTAFAAQALAGKDILVLQTDEEYTEMGTTKEISREVGRFEGAIDYLDRHGLIDPDRVGIVGFSRTCLFVKYALTHSRYHFAAAAVTDGIDAGYFQYMVSANDKPAYAFEADGINGAAPFGQGLATWMQNSPGFNLDRVQTPLRILAVNPTSILWEWEWFAALTRLGKPVEMIVLQDADHILQKPWDRLVSQEGSVDWFAFWLKEEEDPDPSKKAQYLRWHLLRDLARSERR